MSPIGKYFVHGFMKMLLRVHPIASAVVAVKFQTKASTEIAIAIRIVPCLQVKSRNLVTGENVGGS